MRYVTGVLLIAHLFLFPLSSQAAIVTFLMSGTSYSTPSDWNNSDNSIECIGAGGNGGSANNGGGGGGGGAYAKITNLTISGSVSYSIATAGSQADTTFNTTSLVCDAGNNASGATDGTAGLAANSTGTTKFDGGAASGGGGGGAGGTTSAGSNGNGAGSGGNGGTVSGGAGGIYDLSSGAAGQSGGNGTVWQVSPERGAGGGGAEGGPGEADIGCRIHGGNGGEGGFLGGGAGGGGARGSVLCTPGSGGSGSQGIIVTTYTPAAVAAVRSGLKLGAFGSLKITGGGLKIK